MLKPEGKANKAALWGLILAAGDGKRLEQFVHHSLGNKIPKQYVNFIGRRSMLEHTLHRAEKLIPEKRILTVVGRHHMRFAQVRKQLSCQPKQNVIVQPANRDTGPGVFLPLMHLYKRSPEAIVAVFPSDHFIWQEDRFMEHVELAALWVAQDPSRIILLGVEPQDPETDYGYLIPYTAAGPFAEHGFRRVARFIEKPTAAVARSLVKVGALWNTMVMVFKVGTFLELAQQMVPTTCRQFDRILAAIDSEAESDTVDEVYRNLDPLNFSKGILERLAVIFPESLLTLPVFEIFWSDWGSPQRVIQVQQKLGLTLFRSARSGEGPRAPLPLWR